MDDPPRNVPRSRERRRRSRLWDAAAISIGSSLVRRLCLVLTAAASIAPLHPGQAEAVPPSIQPSQGIPAAAIEPLPGGRFPFKVYGPSQGMPTASIHALAQDGDGFLWLGTENGLYRYDGSGTMRWGRSEGLPSDWVMSLAAHPEGGLWVGTNSGLVRLREGRIEPVHFEGAEAAADITCLEIDAEGRLWGIGNGGAFRQTGPAEFEPPAGWSGGSVTEMALDAGRGKVWFVDGAELIAFDDRDGSAARWGTERGLSGNPLGALAVDGAGCVWTAEGRRMFRLDPGAESFSDLSDRVWGGVVTGSFPFRDAAGDLWWPTTNGVLVLRPGGWERLGGERGLPLSWVKTGLQDRDGGVWLVGSSLVRLLGGRTVTFYREADGLPSDLVWTIARTGAGVLYAGTQDGLARLGPDGWARVRGTDGLMIYSMAEDDTGRLWLASPGNDLHAVERWRPSARPVPLPGFERRFEVLLKDGAGRLWGGCVSDGVVRLLPGPPTPDLRPADLGVEAITILGLAEDSAGRIWAAAEEGLFVRLENGWRRFGTGEGLKAEALLGVSASPDGSLWIWYEDPYGATQLRFEAQRIRVLRHLTESEGLPSNLVYGVRDDGRGRVWVTMDLGIALVREAGILRLGQGLPSPDCSATGLMLDADGSLWTGTTSGLVRVDATVDERSVPPPGVHLLQAEWGGSMHRLPADVPETFPHRENALAFRFAAPSYGEEESLRYQVRLVGLGDGWEDSEARHVRYAALPAGSYRFEARASAVGGAWGPAAAFPFVIRAPWWRSPWVFIATVLVLGVLTHGAVHWRTRRLARSTARLEELVALRTEELRTAGEALKAQSLTDPLTGIHNRRYVMLTIKEEASLIVRRYRNSGGYPQPNEDLIFQILDIDRFKRINDAHGHAVGDEVLRRTAEALWTGMRETDSVVRWGGDEFLILTRAASRSNGPALAERIRTIVSWLSLPLEEGRELRWTCSIGFAPFPFLPAAPDWLDWERVLDLADTCLYTAKRSGRNAWSGVAAAPSFAPTLHGPRLGSDLAGLAAEGAVLIHSSDPAGSPDNAAEVTADGAAE